MNLFKKITATAALVALTSGFMVSGVSAATSAQIEAANLLAEKGIVVDQSSNPADYELDRNVLRQEIAAVARGIAGIAKKSTCEGDFSDVSATSPNTWACYTVEALRDANLIAANDKFRPEDNITKGESIGMVVEACMGDEYAYDATKTDIWQKQVVDFAATNGIVTNFSDYNTLATRGFVFEAAANCYGEEEVAIEDLLCQLMGTCTGDTVVTDPVEPTNPTTPVVDGELTVELSPENPASGNVPVSTNRARLLTFEVTAGDEDVTLNSANLSFKGLGNPEHITDIALYAGDVKVTRGGRKFQSDNETELTFERDVVVKAGDTVKMYVGAYIDDEASDDYQTYTVVLDNIDASTTVAGTPVTGPTLYPILATNVAMGEITVDTISSDITIGDDVKLADFSIEETRDRENLVVKSITFDVSGVDSEDIDNLMLTAEGKEVTADFTYQRGKIVASMDYEITAGETVDFALSGTLLSGIDDELTIEFDNDPVYALGKVSNVTAQVALDEGETNILADARDIDGSEINIAFNETNIDEVKPETDDFLVGELVISSASNYTINELQVMIENIENDVALAKIIEDVKVNDLLSDNSLTSETATKFNFLFEDIYLVAGEEKVLPITMSIKKDDSDNPILNGLELKVTPKVLEVEDEDNGETYNSDSELSDIMSSTSLSSKNIEIENASFELVAVETNDTQVVLYNGAKTVLHRMKAYVGDASAITVESLRLNTYDIPGVSNDLTDLNKVIDKVTLNIGGKSFDGDVESTYVEFDSINAEIKAGANNVEFLVYATLKDVELDDEKNHYIALEYATIDVEDEDNNTLTTETGLDVDQANSDRTFTEIRGKGEFYGEVSSSDDNIDTTVLAGTNGVNIAKLKMQAEYEDADIEKLVFEVVSDDGDFKDTFNNLQIKDGDTVIADGARVITSGTKTTIEFKDFTLPKSSTINSYMLVADINDYDTAGSATVVDLGSFTIKADSITVEGNSSNRAYDDEYSLDFREGTTSVSITIAPIEFTYAVSREFKSGLNAEIKATIKTGDNDLNSNDVTIQTIRLIGTLKDANVKSLIVLDSDGNEVKRFETTDTVDFEELDFSNGELNDISNGDTIKFKATKIDSETDISITIENNGIVYTSNDSEITDTFEVTNDSEDL